MIRRYLSLLLVISVGSVSLPSAASAGESAKAPFVPGTLNAAITKAVASAVKGGPSLQQAQQPAQQAGAGRGLSKPAKIGIGVAAIAAAVATGLAIAKGPEARPWP